MVSAMISWAPCNADSGSGMASLVILPLLHRHLLLLEMPLSSQLTAASHFSFAIVCFRTPFLFVRTIKIFDLLHFCCLLNRLRQFTSQFSLFVDHRATSCLRFSKFSRICDSALQFHEFVPHLNR